MGAVLGVWDTIAAGQLSPPTSLPAQPDRRDFSATTPAPLPAPGPVTSAFGGAASGGAAFALVLLLCLSTFVWVAPPLRRWLRRQPGSRMLPVYVASFESPG